MLKAASCHQPVVITKIEEFAYKRKGEEKSDDILFGLRFANGPHWFSLTPALARRMGRALLAAGGRKYDEPGGYFLDTFRAARIDMRLGGMTPEAAAAKHGIDVELLTAWIARLNAA